VTWHSPCRSRGCHPAKASQLSSIQRQSHRQRTNLHKVRAFISLKLLERSNQESRRHLKHFLLSIFLKVENLLAYKDLESSWSRSQVSHHDG
jgi:hypothetical protein